MKNCCECYTELVWWKKWCILGFTIILITSLFLIGFSIVILEPKYYGLKYDGSSMTVDSINLYPSGRHFLGLGNGFLKFPKQQQTILFSTNATLEKLEKSGADFSEDILIKDSFYVRTLDGLSLKCDIYVGYLLSSEDNTQVQASQLFDIYSNFGDDHNDYISHLTQSVVRDVFQNYKALLIPEKLSEIQDLLQETMSTYLTQFYFKLATIDIVNIEFPSQFQDIIISNSILKQNETSLDILISSYGSMKASYQNIANQEALTIISKAYNDGEIQAMLLKNEATLQSTYIKQTALKLKDVKEAMMDLKTFLWIYLLKYSNSSNIILDTTMPTIS